MFFKIRTNLFFYYRLFFIALFLLLGTVCAGIVVLDYYADINLIETADEIDRQALLAVACMLGALGFLTAFIMIFLMREKRGTVFDRRQLSKPLDFIDRRSNSDRRSL